MNPYLPNSSPNSSDDEYSLTQTLIAQQIYNNNCFISEILRVQDVHPTHGGSVPGHRTINRDREAAEQRLFNDYFAENPTFNATMFRRHFLMARSLFISIANVVKDHDDYFVQRREATNRLGLSMLQKITVVFRVLAYALPADTADEYINIGESTAVECVKRFCRAIVEIFGERYLRSPTANDIVRLLHVGKQRGFPGTNNYINVLDRSHLFSDLTRGIASPTHYVIQGKEYNMGYYLADNIYPKWSTLVQTIHDLRSAKKKYFAMKQESCKKDVERAFGVLQSRFAIVANPARFWSKDDLRDIMSACIIMHNMIIEDERDLDAPIQATIEVPTPDVEMANETSSFQAFVARYRQIRDRDAHIALRNALIDHMWEEYSNSEM